MSELTLSPRGSQANPIDPFEGGNLNPHSFCRNRVQLNKFLMRQGLWYFCGGKIEPTGNNGFCVGCEIANCLEVMASIAETKIEDELDAEQWIYANAELERLRELA